MDKSIIPSPESLLAAALDYHARGWSVIPMAVTFDGDEGDGEKKPARKWKKYQSQRAGERTFRRWFADTTVNGVAVVFGGVSGGLLARDYDALADYQAWAEAYPELAATLPTMATARGRQVFAVAAPGCIQSIRRELGKSSGTGAIKIGTGELRAGVGCYSVLPPSPHPSGCAYTWLIPPGDDIPTVDIRDCGFFVGGSGGSGQSVTHTTPPPQTHTTPHHNTISCIVSDERFLSIEAAIEASLPPEPGTRHFSVFDFVRLLKALPDFAGATAESLEPEIRRWHARAVERSPKRAKEWWHTWCDFLEGWAGAKYPAGRTALVVALERADRNGLPAVARPFGDGPLGRLIGLCAELHRENGDAPFPVSTGAVGEALGTDFRKVADWLNRLCAAGILRRESEFRFPGKAAEYRYLPPL